MTRILHLLDSFAGWEERVALGQLLHRLPADKYTQTIAALSGFSHDALPVGAPAPRILPSLPLLPAFSAPALLRLIDRSGIDVIHAWGIHGAIAACATSDRPVVLHLFSPTPARDHARKLRTIARRDRFAVICSAEIVRRRLVESGIPPDQTVVIRPGVDFAAVGKLRRSALRERMGIASDDYAVLVPEPVTLESGAFDAFWAASLLNHSQGGIKVIVPGGSDEARRIERLQAAIPSPHCLVRPGPRVRFEEIIPIADVLAVAPQADIATTSIAWAMAASVPVIGSATYAVAELIANKVNGLLFKRPAGKGAAPIIARLLQDRESQQRYKEAAHGQAYEVFGLRRFIDQTTRLYDNLLRGVSPAEGISDSARSA